MNKLELQLIKSICENTVDNLHEFHLESRHFRENGEVFEWLENYYDQNKTYPSWEITKTKYNLDEIEVTEKIIDVVDAIKSSKRDDIFLDNLHRTITIMGKKGRSEARKYLLAELEKEETNDFSNVYNLADENFRLAEIEYEKRRKAYEENGYYGIPSGLGAEFDAFLNGGWQNGNLYGFLAKSGIGKSFISVIITNGATKHGVTPMYVALEGTIEREYNRLLTAATEISNAALMSGMATLDEYRIAKSNFTKTMKMNGIDYYLVLHGNHEVFTPKILKNTIKKYKNTKLVIVDYLTLMGTGGSNYEKQWEEYQDISKQLKVMATTLNIPVIGILQSDLSIKKGDLLTESNIAAFKGMIRDFDIVTGINQVEGKNNVLQFNEVKNRDGNNIARANANIFAAYYRTNFDKGLIKFDSWRKAESDF
jgi:replicative DNA helicase